ncbi:hypothetical protein KW787_00515 [Candidatus Pacearchaeota archaeon]|nr:hypothetical protein [Candidatus Pacearchaeota archaeon]
MNRLGEKISENVVGITVVAIGIGILLGALVIGYYSFTSNQDTEKAKAVLDSLEGKIGVLKDGETGRFIVQGPADWYLLGWNKDNPDAPGRCSLKSCLCVCKERIVKSCQDTSSGLCRTFDAGTLTVKSSVSDGLSPKGLDLPLYTGVEYIQFPKNLVELRVSKTDGGIYIGASK